VQLKSLSREERLKYARDRYKKWYGINGNQARKTARDRYKKNREYHRKRNVAYLSEPKNRIRQLVYNTGRRPGRPPLLCTYKELFEYLLTTDYLHCACCGNKLDYTLGRGQKNHDDGPSIDRIDNNFSYAIDNVAIICMKCNWTKLNMALNYIPLTFPLRYSGQDSCGLQAKYP
jgi:5-methylcytosine-specific restriction endonuclease McrA